MYKVGCLDSFVKNNWISNDWVIDESKEDTKSAT